MPDRDQRAAEGTDEDTATVVEVPVRKRRSEERVEVVPAATAKLTPVAQPGSASGPFPGLAAASSSAREADAAAFNLTLRQAEIARTRRVVPFMVAVALIAVALMPFAGGDPLATRIVYVGVACALVALGYLYWLSGNLDRFTEGRVAIAYGVAVMAAFSAVYYWGLFSPAAAMIALGIFFITLGRSLRIGAGLYVSCALYQGALAFAVIGGYLGDRGLVTADRASVREQVTQQVMLQVIFALTYLVARATRIQLDKAVGDHDQAVRAIAQRDALLVEARQDLDQALQIGGPGRYSDQQVGSFRIGFVIGRGAMGEVYDAVHAETGEPAAVKLLNASGLVTPGQLTRFYREARAAAKLVSPHIVHLIEVSNAGGVVPYLAMERLRGRDLAQILRERRRLPLPECVQLAQHVARGLEEARRVGIVHRDVKPQNLFLADLGSNTRLWKVLDFGVSKLGDHQGTLTKDHVVGTPMYMAPEQARGGDVDHRADSYALAAVCYRALTGQPPYAGRDLPTILYNVVHRIPQRPSELARLPRDVDRVLAIGLAKEPEDRFATAIELADALTAAASGRLDRALRERADAAIVARPWGSGG